MSAPTASSSYTQAFFDVAVQKGADPEHMMTILGYEAPDLANTARRFACAKVLTMLAEASRQTGSASLGLSAGLNFTPAAFGDVGLAGICAPNLMEGIRVNSAYEPLNQQFGRTKLIAHGDTVRVHWRPHPDLDDINLMRPVTEAVFTGLANMGRWLLWQNEGHSITISFRHAQPAIRAPYDEFFQTHVQYAQDSDFIQFSMASATQPLPQANPEMFETLQIRLDNALSNLENDEITTSLVRRSIQHMITHEAPTLAKVAQSLGFGEKTLSRRLKKEGTSFGDLLKIIRIENYQFYRQEGTKTLAEIAYALGYKEQSSFTRAYRSWFGHPPTEDTNG